MSKGFSVQVTRYPSMAAEVTEFANYEAARKFSDTFGRGRYQTVYRCCIVDLDTMMVMAS